MRLRLFDRIRRFAPSRRRPADTASEVSGAQGRHRRGRRHGPATAPSALIFPGKQETYLKPGCFYPDSNQSGESS